MPNLRHQFTLVAILLVIAACLPLLAQNPSAPDSTLYTTYQSFGQNISWIVCGSTQQSEGCYSSGQLGPFGIVGALLESSPAVKGNVVTRGIYVVDTGAGSNGNEVKLYVYKKVDTVSTSYDSVTVTLAKTVTLPLVGGAGTLCSMAANNRFLFIGTDQSNVVAEVQKSNLSVTQIGAGGVTSITADSYGYVTVTGGNQFSVYGPSGGGEGDGGGSPYMLNTINAVPGSALPKSDDQPVRQLKVRPKR